MSILLLPVYLFLAYCCCWIGFCLMALIVSGSAVLFIYVSEGLKEAWKLFIFILKTLAEQIFTCNKKPSKPKGELK